MEFEKSKNSAFYSGLTEKEVERSRQLHGTNYLTPAKRKSWWRLYLEKYNDPVIRILLAAIVISAVLSFYSGEIIETLGIIIAVFFATTIGFIFEMDASRKFDVLASFNEDSPVKVRRDGVVMLVPRHDIVVGDIVLLEMGDEIPADGNLLTAMGLEVNESSLTGELMTEKSVAITDVPSSSAYPANMVYRSTMVMNGRGVMRVTEVGDNTEIGHVARKSMETTDVETPLDKQLKRLAKQISKVGIIISILAFVVFVAKDYFLNDGWKGYDTLQYVGTFLKYFMLAVTLIVMAVPEGLPMAITLSLALNMRRMLKSNNLVRKLHASETMGAVTVICTDKTGTLTQNKMTVADVYHCNVNEDALLLAYSISSNTTAELDENGNGIGNPTEVALLSWLLEKGYGYQKLRQNTKIIEQIPFSSEKKYMSTTAEIDGVRHTFVKGAPEVVMAMTDSNTFLVQEKLVEWQRQAMRTIAIAVDGKLQAVVAISDPIRDDVSDAVAECREAGMNVKIVTGDNADTAIEIARQIGIWDDDTADDCHITGTEFQALGDDVALERVKKVLVMSRARPGDKQRLVQLLQKAGEVVAVTGDGTNDAPALNYAHVGLSLGSGTYVAKEASEITLLDDSFKSIVKGVMWGRSLYKNLQRFLFFQLTVNVVALLLSLFGALVGKELPLTVTQILWINVIMDTMASLALSSLPPSREVMKDSPRNQNDSVITRTMLKGIAFIGISMFVVLLALLWYFERNDNVSIHELTIFFTVFVMMQFWNLFNAKTFGSNHSAFRYLCRDGGLLLVLLLILVCQWLIVTFGAEMFRTEPLSWREWLYIFVGTSVVMVLGELWQMCKRIRLMILRYWTK